MYIVVTGRGAPEAIDAYLYDHASRIVTTVVGVGGVSEQRFVALVRTANDRYLTEYQADRLASGLYGALVFEVFDLAIDGFTGLLRYPLSFVKPIDTSL